MCISIYGYFFSRKMFFMTDSKYVFFIFIIIIKIYIINLN